MQNYSTTQASNLTVFAGAVVILLAKGSLVLHPTSLTADDIAELLASAGIVIAAIISFISRFKQGDLKLSGVRKN